MIEKQVNANVYGESSIFTLRFYNEEDLPWLKTYFEAWKALQMCSSMEAVNDEGLYHDERSPNIPEAISETLYCMLTTSGRYYKPSPKKNKKKKIKKKYKAEKLKNRSFDAFDIVNEITVQIKASQMEYDCTSFGPKTKQDKIIFIDFYNDGNIDGTIDVYEIPGELITNVIVCKKDQITYEKRKKEGKRPRFSIKKLVIEPNDIQPIYKKVKLW
jgi:hypothetical protein